MAHRLVALASYASGLRLPDTGEYDHDRDNKEEGLGKGDSRNNKPRRRSSVPPLMTALCNEVEIMYVCLTCRLRLLAWT
jgi:hypothetical protein